MSAELTPLLAARLVAACGVLPYHDQVAQSCGVTYSTLRYWLLKGATSPEEPYASFARDYYEADMALCRRAFSHLTHKGMDMELKELALDDVPEDLYAQIDDYYGPLLKLIVDKVKKRLVTVSDDDDQAGRPKVSIKMRSPATNTMWAWFNARWPSFDRARSIGHLLESKEAKAMAITSHYSQSMSADEIKALEAAGWVRKLPSP